ncbi:Rna1p [Paramicrosporidium saccamoebae]|uniref:Rna1p n=1 Tax=Paramicrosporidium saccamoebae TaxID=1246581 RepID=A0A2H9TQ15_9FUNG|nr:Rna1p [Paramicrosporidium saccamoebae]
MGNSLNKSSKSQAKQPVQTPKESCKDSGKCAGKCKVGRGNMDEASPSQASTTVPESVQTDKPVVVETLKKEVVVLPADEVVVVSTDETAVMPADKTVLGAADETAVISADEAPVLPADEMVVVTTDDAVIPVTSETIVVATDEPVVITTNESKDSSAPALQELSIANQKLKLNSADDVAEYVATIKANPGLKTVKLNGNTLGVDASKALAEALAGCDSIEEFYLNDCFTGRMKEEVHVAVEAFGQVLKNKSTLRVVDYSDNAFGPVGAKAAAVLLSEATGLQELILNNNGLGPEGGKIIAQSLLNCQKLNIDAGKQSSLRRVEIGRNRLENGSSALMGEAFKSHGLLKEIALPQNGIRPEGIAELSNGIAANPTLIQLNLQDNTFTSTGSQAFARALKQLKSLKVLNIGDCLLGSDGCEMVITSLASSQCPIELLNLQYNEMDEQGLEHLTKNLHEFTSLKVLMLNGNCFNPTGTAADALKEALQTEQRADILDNWSDMEFYSEDEESDAETQEPLDDDNEDDDEKEDLADEIARMNIAKTD